MDVRSEFNTIAKWWIAPADRSTTPAPAPAPPPAADTSIPTPPPASGDAVADAGDPSTWMVTETGIGPLRAGMTRTQVEAAIDTSLDATPPSEGSCVMTPLPGAPAGTALMMVGDTLVRVDVFRSSTTRTAASPATARDDSRRWNGSRRAVEAARAA
jgi:hypothetical protein